MCVARKSGVSDMSGENECPAKQGIETDCDPNRRLIWAAAVRMNAPPNRGLRLSLFKDLDPRL